MANMHYRNNMIHSVEVGDDVFTDPSAIQQAVYCYYKNLFAAKPSPSFYLDNIPIKRISPSTADSMIVPFSLQEIYLSLMSCNDQKALGPDGFNFIFYKKAWYIIKEDILQLFHFFHTSENIPRDLNHSFMVLIPKVKGAQ